MRILQTIGLRELNQNPSKAVARVTPVPPCCKPGPLLPLASRGVRSRPRPVCGPARRNFCEVGNHRRRSAQSPVAPVRARG
jgi:hypothetical protein